MLLLSYHFEVEEFFSFPTVNSQLYIFLQFMLIVFVVQECGQVHCKSENLALTDVSEETHSTVNAPYILPGYLYTSVKTPL